ncbi:MAG: DNA (cytosine-5-)-methyltransferase [Phycisphaerales bacterium]|nr:DNA (cytosine-5-)-methyltransferase [Phycisphaerales bacterium]
MHHPASTDRSPEWEHGAWIGYPAAVKNGQLPLRRTKGHERKGPRFAEFFAGIGLVRMGLEARGWNLAYANDLDPEKRAMYEAHFGDADEHFELGDVHRVDGSALPDVELATASFPCTDLSLAGARLGFKGEHSSAFWGFISALRGMGPRRPLLVMLENVVGFLTSHEGSDFQSAMEALNELGYSVDAFILDARWFVPQSRPRLFVVGSMIPDADALESAPESRIRPKLLSRFVASHSGIRWQLRSLPDPPKQSERLLADILENLPDNAPAWWSGVRANYLYNQFSDRHRTTADAMIAKRRWSYATVFRRVRMQANGEKRSMGELRTDGIAGCLRTPKGGSGRQILFKAGYGRFAARLLTPRECARLMGADEFIIGVPANQAYFGFGDAVCVPAISWIAEHYLNPVLASVRSNACLTAVVGDRR